MAATGKQTAALIEGWLRAHHHQPVTVADLAAGVGLSVRHVHALCRTHHGQTPMQLLRGIRLDHARATLLAAPPAPVPAAVAAAARAARFTRSARFTAAYAQRFGETPAQTLHDARCAGNIPARLPGPARTATGQPSVFEAVMAWWGHAFIIFYARDRWLAMRRDDGFFMPADTLPQLETEMTAELAKRPITAGAGDGRQHLAGYLGPALATRFGLAPVPEAGGAPAGDTREGDGDDDDGEELLDDDDKFLLTVLRAAFPAWDITYSSQMHSWIARTRKTTLCEDSPVLLCAALVLSERRYRQRNGTWTSTGWFPGDGPYLP